jgi:hypothetical protein
MRTNTFLIVLFGVSSFACHNGINKVMMEKIQFDYSLIDDEGLRNGEVAVDYEFCIPASAELLEEVTGIDTGIKVMKSSKGRIGCTTQQWLLINSTHSKGWKQKLYNIARLDYVDRIVETHYE